LCRSTAAATGVPGGTGGIGLVGFASARITAHLLGHSGASDPVLHARMARMEEQVDELTRLLRGVHGAVVATASPSTVHGSAEEEAVDPQLGPIVVGD